MADSKKIYHFDGKTEGGRSPSWTLQTTRDQILSSLFLSVGKYPSLNQAVQRALGWYNFLSNKKKIPGLPFFLVLDLGHLLLWGRNFQFSTPSSFSPSHRLKIAYTEGVLSVVLSGKTFLSLHKILAKLEGSPKALGKALEWILLFFIQRRCMCSSGPPLDGQMVEELQVSAEMDLSSYLEDGPPFQEEKNRWKKSLEELIPLFHKRKTLKLTRADLWEIEYGELLSSAFDLKITRQIVTFLDCIQAYFETPERLPLGGEDRVARGTYPQGGFSQLTRRGNLESLVQSELIYWEDQGVDLFTWRYFTGELLYYEREGGGQEGGREEILFVLEEYLSLTNRLYFPPKESPLFLESPSYKYSVVLLSLIFSLVEALPHQKFFVHFDMDSQPVEIKLGKTLSSFLGHNIHFSWGGDLAESVKKRIHFYWGNRSVSQKEAPGFSLNAYLSDSPKYFFRSFLKLRDTLIDELQN